MTQAFDLLKPEILRLLNEAQVDVRIARLPLLINGEDVETHAALQVIDLKPISVALKTFVRENDINLTAEFELEVKKFFRAHRHFIGKFSSQEWGYGLSDYGMGKALVAGMTIHVYHPHIIAGEFQENEKRQEDGVYYAFKLSDPNSWTFLKTEETVTF